MPRPGSGGPSKGGINGTSGADIIEVVDGGVLINGVFTAISATKIAAGLTINGNGGADDISGGAGVDTLDGGDGDDILRDTIDSKFIGGAGVDTVDLSGSSTGVALDIQGRGVYFADFQIYVIRDGYLQAEFGREVRGTLQGIENVIGSSGSDFIMANSAANIIHGGDGNDILSAAQNDGLVDQLFGEGGNDNLYAGSGNDELTGGDGSDIFGFDPANTNGQWVIHDYTENQDKVVLFPYSGGVSWGTQSGTGWVQAILDGGDTITFVGVTDDSIINLTATMSWPPL